MQRCEAHCTSSHPLVTTVLGNHIRWMPRFDFARYSALGLYHLAPLHDSTPVRGELPADFAPTIGDRLTLTPGHVQLSYCKHACVCQPHPISKHLRKDSIGRSPATSILKSKRLMWLTFCLGTITYTCLVTLILCGLRQFARKIRLLELPVRPETYYPLIDWSANPSRL